MSGAPTTDPVRDARRFYAEELRVVADVKSQALHEAFASVPREHFLGPGPWRIFGVLDHGYRTTDSDDPRHVHHDVLVALDESRGINNGQPSFWAFLIDQLAVASGESVIHLGCGTGYYTAILAELVGPGGRVRAIEVDERFGGKACEALTPWPQVTVEIADGASTPLERADVVVASAGTTGPKPAWLDALAPGGRLLLPMTSAGGPGGMLLITRREGDYAARFLCDAAFFDFCGARDAEMSERLAAALSMDRGVSVRSLRRDAHQEDDSCWLHAGGWCLSRRDVGSSS